jgi:anti-sigma regulatory factor (Ser/Thr protein kinase)
MTTAPLTLSAPADRAPACLARITRLRVPASPAEVRDARDAVVAALDTEEWDAEIPRVQLAVGEALANALVHGSEPGAQIEVTVVLSETRASVRVRDNGRRGRPFRAAPAAPQAPPRERTHGRGRLLMWAMADRVEMRPAGAGTEVRLEFRPVVEDLAA